MLTGRKTVETAALGINVGEVFRFLCKPFEPEVLCREVDAAIAHHRDQVAVAREWLTVVRRQRLIEALEQDYPGISTVSRDDSGAYVLDGDARRRTVTPLFVSVHALFADGDRQS
jgi:DNA-binding response OmpR family regulator